jgi:ribosome modulation factor
MNKEDADRLDRAHRGAYYKGRAARHAGKTLDDCPYQDKRRFSGGLTYSRSFRKVWAEGWEAADREIWNETLTEGVHLQGGEDGHGPAGY